MTKIQSVLFVALLTTLAACGDTNIIINPPTQASPVTVQADAGIAPSAITPDLGMAPDATVANASDTVSATQAVDTGSKTDAKSVAVDAGSTPDVERIAASDAQPADALLAGDTMPNTSLDSGSVTEAGTEPSVTVSSCKVTANIKIADGSFGLVSQIEKGFGVRWFGSDGNGSISYFRSFDWSGKPTSDQITLLNVRNIIGGKDDYLVLVVDDRGTAREWSVYRLSADGVLGNKQTVGADPDKSELSVPFLSFDGTYFRVTTLLSGSKDWCAGGTVFNTGRISANGIYVGETLSCLGASRKTVTMQRVIDSGIGKPVFVVGVWDADQQNSEQTMQVIDAAKGIYTVFAGNDLQRRAIDVLASANGPMLSWYMAAKSNVYYLSPLDDGNVVIANQMPAGFIPKLIDGLKAVGITVDYLSSTRDLVTVSLKGQELSRTRLPTAKSNCNDNLAGTNGKFVNLDAGCFGDKPEVWAMLVACD